MSNLRSTGSRGQILSTLGLLVFVLYTGCIKREMLDETRNPLASFPHKTTFVLFLRLACSLSFSSDGLGSLLLVLYFGAWVSSLPFLPDVSPAVDQTLFGNPQKYPQASVGKEMMDTLTASLTNDRKHAL